MPTESSPASASFTIEVGAFIRGQIRREIEKAAWSCGLEIETQESKGFFESVYKFTVRGNAKVVKSFMRDAEVWMSKIAVSA